MSEMTRKYIPAAIFTFCSAWFFFEYFINIPGGLEVSGYISSWVAQVSNFALILGAINLFRYHLPRIVRKEEGEWYHSALVLVLCTIMYISGFVSQPLYNYLYREIYWILMGSLVAYVGFYLYTSTYRTYRMRSWEAAALLVSCATMMLSNASITASILPAIPQIGFWIADTPAMGAWRGFLMSAATGMFAIGVRAALGIERSYIGEARVGE